MVDREWVSLEQVARARGISVAQAATLAEHEQWPKVFRLHETLVLMPFERSLR